MRVTRIIPKPRRQPRLLVIGGGIGSGKTTLRDWLLRQRDWRPFSKAALVDTDQIRSSLRSLAEVARKDLAPLAALHREASRLAEARLNRLLAAGVDIVWESTLGWEPDTNYAAGKLELSYLARFRARRYRIFLHGVTCDHAVAEQRFRLRAAREDRDVSDQRRILGSHRRFEANVPRIARAVYAFRLWRSGPAGFRVVTQGTGAGGRMPATPGWISPPCCRTPTDAAEP